MIVVSCLWHVGNQLIGAYGNGNAKCEKWNWWKYEWNEMNRFGIAANTDFPTMYMYIYIWNNVLLINEQFVSPTQYIGAVRGSCTFECVKAITFMIVSPSLMSMDNIDNIIPSKSKSTAITNCLNENHFCWIWMRCVCATDYFVQFQSVSGVGRQAIVNAFMCFVLINTMRQQLHSTFHWLFIA